LLSNFKGSIEAVLLDVDGTLYNQFLLRSFMILELGTLPIRRMSLKTAVRTWRGIRCFRRVREELRSSGELEDLLDKIQYVEVAKRIGETPAALENLISIWIFRRPLKYLRICRRRGVGQFLSFLESKGLEVGVFSDYPVVDKLKALGFYDKVTIALSASDPEINALKPHPKGFLRAATIWGISPEEILYVGDRPEIDAVGAAAAGMRCAILSGRTTRIVHTSSGITHLVFPTFDELKNVLTNILEF
jgi:FMN phosphatase YigB (HAD superfamily)